MLDRSVVFTMLDKAVVSTMLDNTVVSTMLDKAVVSTMFRHGCSVHDVGQSQALGLLRRAAL